MIWRVLCRRRGCLNGHECVNVLFSWQKRTKSQGCTSLTWELHVIPLLPALTLGLQKLCFFLPQLANTVCEFFCKEFDGWAQTGVRLHSISFVLLRDGCNAQMPSNHKKTYKLARGPRDELLVRVVVFTNEGVEISNRLNLFPDNRFIENSLFYCLSKRQLSFFIFPSTHPGNQNAKNVKFHSARLFCVL